VNALKKGLGDLQDVCDVVAEKFWSERQSFNAEQGIER
jgi:DNA-directed RNA polymerase I and III subunit RPAC2